MNGIGSREIVGDLVTISFIILNAIESREIVGDIIIYTLGDFPT
jgi:hypothetical protein